MAAIVGFSPQSKVYFDPTGRFLYVSSRGNQYLLVVYDYDSNAILVEPHKSRAAAHIRDAWLKIHQKLSLSGNAPSRYILDNECSTDFRSALTKHRIIYQLVPPHVHRRNAAELAIQTFKNHF